jgi:hypothetical protein
MIQNEEELTIVRQQLARVERALESLRRDVLPKNKRNFEVLSEGYVDQIAALRQEIDTYTGGRSPAGEQAPTNGPQRSFPPVPDPAEQR